jgi:hypothetical protein
MGRRGRPSFGYLAELDRSGCLGLFQSRGNAASGGRKGQRPAYVGARHWPDCERALGGEWLD